MTDELLRLKLQKIKLLEAETEHIDKLPHLYMHKHYAWSEEFENDIETKIQVVCSANQVGKLLPCVTLVPTIDGFRRVDQIKVGDRLFGRDGKPTTVTDIPFEGEDDGFVLTFSDGTSITAGANHLWVCKTFRERFSKKRPEYGTWNVLSTLEMVEWGKYAPRAERAFRKVVIPFSQPIEFPQKDLFDPYALGLLLGDGCFSSSVVFHKPDKELIDYFVKNHGGKLYVCGRGKPRTRLPSQGAAALSIKQFGLMGHVANMKFIPPEYMTASAEQRLALLRGLMDTDGWVGPDGDVTEFNTASSRLADGVCELVFSLGGSVKRFLKKCHYVKDGRRHQAQDSHRLRIKMPPEINPFSLERKARIWRGDIRYRHERVIESITPVGRIRGRCFTVDNEDHTFVAGKNYVVSHNSTTLLRKIFRIATEPEKWPKMWPNLPQGMLPSQWWYLYPSSDIAAVEYVEKWQPLLPKYGTEHPLYGWKEIKKDSKVVGISFNTGINIYWKYYSQAVTNLQASSCYLMACDEEVGTSHIPELQMRTRATDGYMFFVFTPTIGQKFWTDVVEARTIWPAARVWQPSLYDCMKYSDGSPSHWTKEKVKRAIDECISEAEKQRRIFGRVLPSDQAGLQYSAFNPLNNTRAMSALPQDWLLYAGIDYGSGASHKAHLSAITFLAVNPEKTRGRIVRFWRGDKTETTAEDVVNKFEELCRSIDTHQIQTAYYDYSARDIGTIAQRRGLPFIQANKGRDYGRSFLNSLFKSGCLTIDTWSDEVKDVQVGSHYLETYKLIYEIEQLRENADKTRAKDDGIDSMRYAVAGVGWAWDDIRKIAESSINGMIGEVPKPGRWKVVLDERQQRLEDFKKGNVQNDTFDVEGELQFWQEQFDQF